MGTFTVPLQVGDLAGRQYVDLEALVDTGAIHTMLPPHVLIRLGIEAVEQVSFQLADDRVVDYQVGEARIRIDGRERTTLVVFGSEGTEPSLGATPLQLLHLAVDPVQERLVFVRGLLKQLRQVVEDLSAPLEVLEALRAPQ